MASIHLYAPQQTLSYSAFIDVKPRQVQAWLAELPEANLRETGEKVRTALVDINRVKMPDTQRQELLGLFVPVVERLAQGLYQTYRDQPLPPSEAVLQGVSSLLQIHASMANGYKILVSAAQRSGKPMDAGNRPFLEAMCGALDYLSRQLLLACEVYCPVPKRVWGDLHYLYLLARKQKLLGAGVGAAGGLSLEDRYKRSVMLALANPYHLNQGEARHLYQKIGAWTAHCKLEQRQARQVPGGGFVVDMGTDSAPRYLPSGMQMGAVYPFVVDVSEVIDILKAIEVELSQHPGEGTDPHHEFSNRKLQATYARAEQAWGGRPERHESRTPVVSDMRILTGLTHCHRLFKQLASPAGGSAQGPAAGEPAPTAEQEGSMRLLDIEEHIQQAIAAVEEQDKVAGTFAGEWGADIESEAAKHQQDFETVSLSVPDNSAIFEGAGSGGPVAEDDTSRWRQRDQSRGGVSLLSMTNSGTRVRVGEVTAYQPVGSRWDEGWTIGTVRWLRVRPGEGIGMGVMALSDDVAAVRSKGVAGVGADSRPTPSLLIPAADPRDTPTTLVTAPAIYEEGTVLALELASGEVIPILLEALVESSDRYAQFRFHCLEQAPRVMHWEQMD